MCLLKAELSNLVQTFIYFLFENLYSAFPMANMNNFKYSFRFVGINEVVQICATWCCPRPPKTGDRIRDRILISALISIHSLSAYRPACNPPRNTSYLPSTSSPQNPRPARLSSAGLPHLLIQQGFAGGSLPPPDLAWECFIVLLWDSSASAKDLC